MRRARLSRAFLVAFAAWRDGEFDAASRAGGQGLGHQVGVVDRVGEEDQTRRVLVVVELGEEGFHDLGRFGTGAGLGVEVTVAPALVGADEEDLDAGLAVFKVEGDDVRLGHASRVDALALLDLGQRLDPVAERGGTFEFHGFGGRGHRLGEIGLNAGGLALQEAFRIIDEGGVALFADLADTRRRATLDLVLQTGAGAAFEHRIRAIAQQEDLLQLVQRAIDCTGAGEGAEVGALFRFLAPMLLDLRIGVFRGDQDVREALVVAQKDVVARLQLLDEVLFQQQSFKLCPRGQEHHRRGLMDHPGDAAGMARGAGVVRDAGLQVARLADVKDLGRRVQHPVDAGATVERAEVILDHLMSGAGFRVSGVGHGLRSIDSRCSLPPKRGDWQEQSCPRNLGISQRRRFQERGFSLVFGPFREVAHFLGGIASY
jgi:hypothetical protein